MPVIDWTKVKRPATPTDGAYVVTLTGKKYVPARGDKNPYIQIESTISEKLDPSDDDEEESDTFNGRKLWSAHSLTEEAMWSLQDALLAFGADPEIFEEAFDPEVKLAEMMGSKAIAEVYQDSWLDSRSQETKINAKVRRYKSMDFI